MVHRLGNVFRVWESFEQVCAHSRLLCTLAWKKGSNSGWARICCRQTPNERPQVLPGAHKIKERPTHRVVRKSLAAEIKQLRVELCFLLLIQAVRLCGQNAVFA